VRLDLDGLDGGERHGAPLALAVLDDHLPGVDVLDGINMDLLAPMGLDGENRPGIEDAAVAVVASLLGENGHGGARGLRRVLHARLPSAEVSVNWRRFSKKASFRLE